MPKMIQIRHVPDELHRKLKVRAAEAGMSLSEYLLRELARSAEKPTYDEWVARLRTRERVPLTNEEIVEAIEAERR